MKKGLFVILSDGETYSGITNCAIFDMDTGKVYSIRKDKHIDDQHSLEGMHWEKGISEILEMEKDDDVSDVHRGRRLDDDGVPIQYPEPPEDDGILGK